MADEESEVRRMVEIANAINTILAADPSSIGDTPIGDTPIGDTLAEAPTDTENDTENAPPSNKDADPTGAVAQSDAAIVMDVGTDTDNLDAAIAAEFADIDGTAAHMDGDYFGPPPALHLAGADGANKALGRTVKADSEMADLSLRMQDTLAEIRHQSHAAWHGADDLLGEMEAARAALVADMRSQIQNIAQATQRRREAIMQELEQLEQESLMARDEMEIMLVKFENSLVDLHKRYFQSAETERERLNRYREFLQFLLDERRL